MVRAYERLVMLPLKPGVRIRYQYSRGNEPPYAVTLEAEIDDKWTTVRCWDNSHEQGHHMHRYTRAGGKEEPVRFSYASCREAMPAAIAAAYQSWEAILDQWHH
jgi:hypothetical protein